MSILDRDALAASPLADLHALASELSIDGYRRLRKADLIDAIITRQGGSLAERPLPTRPVPTRPVPTRPVPTRPVPTRPVPTRPVPTRPVPTRPVPTRPLPRTPRPKKLPPTTRTVARTTIAPPPAAGGDGAVDGDARPAAMTMKGPPRTPRKPTRRPRRARPRTSRAIAAPRTRSSRVRSNCFRTAPDSCA